MVSNLSRNLLRCLLVLILTVIAQFGLLIAVDAQAEGQEYIVQRGDYLHRIAATFYGDGSLWPRIVEATNLKAQDDSSFRTIRDPDVLNIGQKLWIPTLEDGADVDGADVDATEVRVELVSPIDGATVSPRFDVVMAATGLVVEQAGEVRDGAGHMHILVDTDFVEPGAIIPRDEQYIHYWQGELTGTLELEPGVHTLRLQFSDGAHVALEGDQYRDEITVTVAEAGETTSDAIEEPRVFFITPQDGAIVTSPVTIEMGASGLIVEQAGEIREGAGHMHILVDTGFVEPGAIIPRDEQYIHYWQGEMTSTLELEPGVHTLRLQFSDGAHVALEGDQYRDEITVTVAEAGEVTSDATEEPRVFFITPQGGAVVTSPVAIEMGAQGVTVEQAGEVHEGAGHMHVLVDTDFVEPGAIIPRDEQYIHYWQGGLTGTLELEPGVHTLRLQFSDSAHVALEGDQYRDEITVTVAEASEDSSVAVEEPRVFFVTPRDGAVITSPVTIEMGAQGVTVEPAGEVHEGAGHMHVLIDTDFAEPGEVVIADEQNLHFGQGQLTTILELEPGEHTLRLQFADGAHMALEGDQYRDEITVTVQE